MYRSGTHIVAAAGTPRDTRGPWRPAIQNPSTACPNTGNRVPAHNLLPKSASTRTHNRPARGHLEQQVYHIGQGSCSEQYKTRSYSIPSTIWFSVATLLRFATIPIQDPCVPGTHTPRGTHNLLQPHTPPGLRVFAGHLPEGVRLREGAACGRGDLVVGVGLPDELAGGLANELVLDAGARGEVHGDCGQRCQAWLGW